MKHLKKLLPVALVLLLAVLILPGKAEAATVDSGTCGENLTWTLDNAGTLTISGTGPMTDYDWSGSPWCSNASVKKIVIGDGITTISKNAFYSCTNLTSVTIPDSVASIGDYAFYWCNLTSVTIPDSVTSIGDYAFYCCDRLTSVTIPDSITSIGYEPFASCSRLTGIWVDVNNPNYSSDSYGVLFNKDKTTLVEAPGAIISYSIPNSVTSIGDSAFLNCSSLTNVTIPDSVTSIGDSAFYGCDRLTSVTIPDSITSISDYAFCGCYNLKSVTISNNVTLIGEGAFYVCESLTSVTIGNNVTSISNYAFQYCDSLTDVYYYGTEAAWKKISIGADNYALLDATIHFVELMPGDMDSDRKLTTDDAVYLLLHVMFGAEDYPLPDGVSLDLDGDGTTTTNDAVYLLLHVMFGAEDYPLYPDNDPVMTYQEFLAAEDDSTVCIETYVQATESWWENTITAYAQSKDGAYYLYMMDCSEEDAAKLVPGTKIRVTGIKAHWAGLPEIMYGTFEFVEATPYIAEPIDATAMTEAELKANINKLATFKGLTVEKIEYKGGEPGNDIYLTLKNGNISMAFHVEIYLTGEDTDVYKTVGTLAVGDTVDVTGFLHWYEGPYPYIIDIAKVTT